MLADRIFLLFRMGVDTTETANSVDILRLLTKKKTRLVVLDHSKRELNALQFNYVNKDMHIQRVRTCVKECFLELIVMWLNASQKNASWCLGEHI